MPTTTLSNPSALLQRLLESSVIPAEDWEAIPAESRDAVAAVANPRTLAERLLELGLLTSYQAGRLVAGRPGGLVLGNYRLLERLGAGGMGVVYRAEHVRLRRPVAVKVLTAAGDGAALARFYAEARAVAQLQHPNIVAAVDAGEATPDDPDERSE